MVSMIGKGEWSCKFIHIRFKVFIGCSNLNKRQGPNFMSCVQNQDLLIVNQEIPDQNIKNADLSYIKLKNVDVSLKLFLLYSDMTC